MDLIAGEFRGAVVSNPPRYRYLSSVSYKVNVEYGL